MEWWSAGVMLDNRTAASHYSDTPFPITPILQHSITPVCHVVSSSCTSSSVTASSCDQAPRTEKRLPFNTAKWHARFFHGLKSAEIGRASCRERVEISVVSTSVKEKQAKRCQYDQ